MAAMVSATASGRLPRAWAGGWISSPGWDFFWMFGALWGGALLLVGSSSFGLAAVAAWIFFADRLVSIAHSWSTTYMVLFSPLLASERQRRRAKFRWIPLGITLGSFALGLFVAGWQRFPASGELGPELWAFGALHRALLGAALLALREPGFRRALALPEPRRQTRHARSQGGQALHGRDDVHDPADRVSERREDDGLRRAHARAAPSSRGAGSQRIAPVALAVAAVASLGVAAFEIAKPNRSPGKLLYTVVILLHPLLLYAKRPAPGSGLAYLYLLAYLWSHWLIAIGLVGRINTRHYQRRGDSRARVARAPCAAARRDLGRGLAAHLSLHGLRALQQRRLPLQAAARPDRPDADARDRPGAGLLPGGAAPALLLRPLPVPVPRRGRTPRRGAAALGRARRAP